MASSAFLLLAAPYFSLLRETIRCVFLLLLLHYLFIYLFSTSMTHVALMSTACTEAFNHYIYFKDGAETTSAEEDCLPEDESTKHSQDALPHHSCAAAFIFKCCVFVFCMKHIMSCNALLQQMAWAPHLRLSGSYKISFGAGQHICQMVLKKVNWNK